MCLVRKARLLKGCRWGSLNWMKSSLIICLFICLLWVDNIRMDLQEVGCGYMDWIGLAQDRDRWQTLVSAVMNLGVLWNAGNFLTSCKQGSCSRRTLHQVYFCPFAAGVYICGPQQTKLTWHIIMAPWVHFVIREGFISMLSCFQTVVTQHGLVDWVELFQSNILLPCLWYLERIWRHLS